MTDKVVTVASNAALIVDFTNDKMTFTTGKALLSGNAVIYDAYSGGRAWYNPDTPTGTSVSGGSYTNCPSGTSAWNPITKSNATTKVYASRRGNVICK
jgi:hypothetical protein